jgi:hypothetical protein
MRHPDNPDLCACGESADEVSMPHFISCGNDALADPETAIKVVNNVVAAIERQL